MSRNRIAVAIKDRQKGLKRLFAASFLFFFIKGLIWLVVGGFALTRIV